MTLNGKTVELDRTRRTPRTRSPSPSSASSCRSRASTKNAKNQCEDAPVQPAHAGAQHDHVQLPHRQAGPLPLAVLRALRAPASSTATAARCRRSATWTASSMSSEPAVAPAAAGEPNHWRRFLIAVAGRDGDRDAAGRSSSSGRYPPPGNGSVQAAGQRTINDGAGAVAHAGRSCSWCSTSATRWSFFRQRGGAALEGPADPRQRAHPDGLDRHHLADGARARRLRHLRTRSATGTARAAGPSPLDRARRGPKLPGAGDRAAVAVHLPLPDLRRRRDAASSCCRSTGRSSSTSPRWTSIHSFWAYELGVKADANPGVDNIAYVKPTKLESFQSAAPSSAASGTAT